MRRTCQHHRGADRVRPPRRPSARAAALPRLQAEVAVVSDAAPAQEGVVRPWLELHDVVREGCHICAAACQRGSKEDAKGAAALTERELLDAPRCKSDAFRVGETDSVDESRESDTAVLRPGPEEVT